MLWPLSFCAQPVWATGTWDGRPNLRLSSSAQNGSHWTQKAGGFRKGLYFPSLMLVPRLPGPSAPLGRLCTLSVFA